MNTSLYDLIDDIEQDICTCIICYDLYNETDHVPVLLNCGHTLCRSCLRQLYTGKCECPLCKGSLPLQSNEKKNFTITSLLNLLHDKIKVNNRGEVNMKSRKRKLDNSISGRTEMVHEACENVFVFFLVFLAPIVYIWIQTIYINSNPPELFSTCSGDFDLYSSNNGSVVSTHPGSGRTRKTCYTRGIISKYSGIVANKSHGFDSMVFEFSVDVELYEIPHRTETFCEFGFSKLTPDCKSEETIGWYIFKENRVDGLQIQSFNASRKAKVLISHAKYTIRMLSSFRINLLEEEKKIVLFRKTADRWDFVDVVTFTGKILMWPVFAIYRTRTAMVRMSLSPKFDLSFDSSTKAPNIFVANDNKTISNWPFELLSHYKPSVYTTMMSQNLNCSDYCYIPFSIWFEDMYDVPFQETLLEVQILIYTHDGGYFQKLEKEIFILTLKRCIEYGWLGYYIDTYCFQYIDQNKNLGWSEAHLSYWNQFSVFVYRQTNSVSIHSKNLKYITKTDTNLKGNISIQVNVNVSMNIYAQVKSESGNLRIDHRIYSFLVNSFSVIVYGLICIVHFIFVNPCIYCKYYISVLLDKLC